MNELYWITRLDGINVLIGVSMLLSCICTIVFCIIYLTTKGDSFFEEWNKFCCKLLKYSAPTTFLLSLVFILIPTTKEAYMIYGVGGTLDYVQQNEKIQQLPDKVVDALDVWVDSYLQTDSVK